MKKTIQIFGICLSLSTFAEIANYNDLVFTTIQACREPSTFLSASYTNDVANFRAAYTGINERCAADLSLALSLMHRLDADEMCIGNQACFDAHQALVSNIVHSSGLESNSWIRYAAGMEYAVGCNFDGRLNDGFAVSTNMLSRLSVHPADMGQTNFWNAMQSYMRCPELPMDSAFRLNAAVELALQNQWDAVGPYTNSLPCSAIEAFLNEIR